MYKTIIIKNSINTCMKELEKIDKKLMSDGNLFFIVKTEYKNGTVSKDFFDLISYSISLNFNYINTIVVPDNTSKLDNVLYCVWFSKSKKDYYFNKDPIREKSIWKNVEWGKRKKNYNSKGKDPGNVWIPTLDNGKGVITKHIELSIKEIFDRLLASTLTDNDKYLIINDSKIKYNFKNFEGTIKIDEASYGDICFGKYENKKKKNIETPTGTVVFNSSENMDYIKEETVDLIVTSPPYWDLKDYYKKNQIGHESYEIYSDRMMTVWKECYQKLKKTGSLWININIRVRNGNPILLPKLFIDQCKNIGFMYRGILIWHKSSGIPTHKKNLKDHHEYILIFTKTSSTKINAELLSKYNDYKKAEIGGKLFWNINRRAGSIGKKTIHPAIFPVELINRIVSISTKENEVIVDPFLGSGTSMIASINNGRRFIGYEFNEGFKDLMEDRFKKEILNYNTNTNIKYFFKK
ncbi:MAG: site-specific DNA-methyltransferase [Bacilli bacterium]|nr:site-specific DNA-methyltransferase [Bacilli bacterium]